ncbi:TIGR04255 family protein [Streptomyces sp. RPT161]|uniref:TIGR04255 family protein n=1 Tax=Streptomyces sp. RPT161 TaxID=3015993 RepID=UPI0022B8AE6D|nr:TIGR04255 family protein [Streptomyces sp. RPT161]
MGNREIYPSPPLVLTIVELRHTATPALTDSDQASLKAVLAERFPLFRPIDRMVNFSMTPAGIAPQQTTDPRYMTRDNTASITYRPDAIVVETTRYHRRSSLRELVHLAVAARQKVAPADGITRLGVRYINEIRVGIERPTDWAAWIAPALTSISALQAGTDVQAQSWQGLAVFGDQDCGVALRHGNLEGYAVDPSGDLRRSATPPPGPFYLLDLDSYWSPAAETPPVDWSDIERRYDAVALSAYELFEQLVTKDCREVLRRDQ